jgi:Tfp pilus assembly protein PilN
VMVALWAMAGSTIAGDRAELDRLQAEAASAQTQSETLASVQTIRGERDARVQVVKTLAAARIDWAESLDAIARTIPSDVWLSSLSASAAPGAGPAGGAGNAGAIASSGTGPSISLSGCAPSQARVARLMPALRAIPSVLDVSLVSSAATEEGLGTGTSALECQDVGFDLVLFFQGPEAPVAPATPVDPSAPATPTIPAAPATAGTAPTPVAAPTTTTTPEAQPVSAPAGGPAQ